MNFFFFGFEGERACMRGNCVKNYGDIAQIGHEFLFKGGLEGECGCKRGECIKKCTNNHYFVDRLVDLFYDFQTIKKM